MAIKVPDGAYNDKLLKIMMSLHQYDMVFFSEVVGGTQQLPEPDPLSGIFFMPDPIQF